MYLVPIAVGSTVISLIGGYFFYKRQDQENSNHKESNPKQREWKLSITKIYDSLVRIDITLSHSTGISEIPSSVQLFDKNHKKLFVAYKTSKILVSSNESKKIKQEFYAIIKDKNGNEFKTALDTIEIEKKHSLKVKTENLKTSFLSLLKLEKKFRLLVCGGCGEGKSTILKAIFDLLIEHLIFTLKEGSREQIKCYKDENSVTTTIFSIKFTKIIDGEEVEIEIIDCPGFWEKSDEKTLKLGETNKQILQKILKGEVRNGIDSALDLRELLEPTIPVRNPISKPDVVLFCSKYAKITSSPIAHKRFKDVKKVICREAPTVLVGTVLDEGNVYLSGERTFNNPSLTIRKPNEVEEVRTFMLGDNDEDFNEIDYRENDILFSNYSLQIVKVPEIDDYLVPILNYCDANQAFIDSVPSRKELSDFLLIQLMVQSIKSKRSAK